MTEFLGEISKYAMPYLTVEGRCPDLLKAYQLSIPVHQIHHVVAFASLCIGEGATMASEAALLGVPVVYINTLKLGYINMFEDYGLVKQTADTALALEYSLEFLRNPETPAKCQQIRQKFLDDKIDVTAYIVEQIEKRLP